MYKQQPHFVVEVGVGKERVLLPALDLQLNLHTRWLASVITGLIMLFAMSCQARHHSPAEALIKDSLSPDVHWPYRLEDSHWTHVTQAHQSTFFNPHADRVIGGEQDFIKRFI